MARWAQPHPLIGVEEAALMLGQSRSSLYRALQHGDVPFPVFRINGRYRVQRRAIESIISGEATPPPRLAAGAAADLPLS